MASGAATVVERGRNGSDGMPRDPYATSVRGVGGGARFDLRPASNVDAEQVRARLDLLPRADDAVPGGAGRSGRSGPLARGARRRTGSPEALSHPQSRSQRFAFS